MNKNSCTICYETFDSKKNKQLKCPYCPSEQCKECLKKYLLTAQEFKCMFCKNLYTYSSLVKYFGETIVNKDLRDHMSTVLCDLEKAKLPATQQKLQSEINYRKTNSETTRELLKLFFQLQQIEFELNLLDSPIGSKKHWMVYKNNIGTTDIKNFQTNLLDRCMSNFNKPTIITIHADKNDAKIQALIKDRNIMIGKIKKIFADNTSRYHDFGDKTAKKERETNFVLQCPVKDCRGFVNKIEIEDKTIYKCGLCFSLCCKKCHEVKKENQKHECNPDNLKSIKEIKKESRYCPKCAAPISKISGCDQMFCVVCHTGFNWKTNHIITKEFHNPHYLEWKRNKNNENSENGDLNGIENNCITFDSILSKLVSKNSCVIIQEICRLCIHVDQILREKQRRGIKDPEILRTKFLLNEITSNEFKRQLYLYTRSNTRFNEISLVLDAFIDNVKYLFVKLTEVEEKNFSNIYKLPKAVKEIWDKIIKLIIYSQTELNLIGKCYKVNIEYLIDLNSIHKNNHLSFTKSDLEYETIISYLIETFTKENLKNLRNLAPTKKPTTISNKSRKFNKSQRLFNLDSDSDSNSDSEKSKNDSSDSEPNEKKQTKVIKNLEDDSNSEDDSRNSDSDISS